MAVKIRAYDSADVPEMIRIWNQVVDDGIAFPQEDQLGLNDGAEFFASQTYCGVADEDGRVLGLYILHPNNVGRCAQIANASYAVDRDARGKHVGWMLVSDSLEQGRENYFRVLQFNAVVATNTSARHLYEKLGFVQLGTIPGAFRMPDGTYEDICPYYHKL